MAKVYVLLTLKQNKVVMTAKVPFKLPTLRKLSKAPHFWKSWFLSFHLWNHPNLEICFAEFCYWFEISFFQKTELKFRVYVPIRQNEDGTKQYTQRAIIVIWILIVVIMSNTAFLIVTLAYIYKEFRLLFSFWTHFLRSFRLFLCW